MNIIDRLLFCVSSKVVHTFVTRIWMLGNPTEINGWLSKWKIWIRLIAYACFVRIRCIQSHCENYRSIAFLCFFKSCAHFCHAIVTEIEGSPFTLGLRFDSYQSARPSLLRAIVEKYCGESQRAMGYHVIVTLRTIANVTSDWTSVQWGWVLVSVFNAFE